MKNVCVLHTQLNRESRHRAPRKESNALANRYPVPGTSRSGTTLAVASSQLRAKAYTRKKLLSHRRFLLLLACLGHAYQYIQLCTVYGSYIRSTQLLATDVLLSLYRSMILQLLSLASYSLYYHILSIIVSSTSTSTSQYLEYLGSVCQAVSSIQYYLVSSTIQAVVSSNLNLVCKQAASTVIAVIASNHSSNSNSSSRQLVAQQLTINNSNNYRMQ